MAAVTINLEQKFGLFDDHWSPRVIAELNGQAVKLAKVKGEFVWHDHAAEDELFLIVKGTLLIDIKDKDTIRLEAGELCVVPKSTLHRPRTLNEEEVWLMLLEPIDTKHTGDVEHELTKTDYTRI